MLQKELIKRLKGRYETKMDDKGWLNVSSDGIHLCRVKYNGNCIINDDENLSDEYREKIADIQDEVLTVREYIGLYERAPQMKAEGVTEYKQLASFGDTVLAAAYSENNGFMFVTWQQSNDGSSMCWGDYTTNYECAKETFAMRSGLISEHRLFTEKESADLYRCVDFAIANCETLTSAVWSVEMHGDRLFGRIDCSLKEALTAEETEALRDWIIGQCSDGYAKQSNMLKRKG